jgi:hypothetical protein
VSGVLSLRIVRKYLSTLIPTYRLMDMTAVCYTVDHMKYVSKSETLPRDARKMNSKRVDWTQGGIK